MKPVHFLYSFSGILAREFQRSIQQRTRFVSALVRPLLWLAVFAAGFRSALEGVVVPPHATPVDYEIYITPGLVGIVVLFNSMQSSLSMVYDREMGSMRVLLTSPMPRSWLLICKLIASALVSLVPVYGFLLVARLFDVLPPVQGYLAALPAVVLTAVMLGALGLILASVIEQLENFAGVMNFVVFPMFFLSSALYPLTAMRDAS
ncbi:MAG: ABC transporter permease, partial [Luminiphilus sp.]